MKFQTPRGTQDVLPEQSHVWHHLETTFAQLASRYGYREIRTPIFEDSELFLRTAGETSDIVSKEMYRFKDKGDRDIALKPEGTAPAMRAVIEHSLCPPGVHWRAYYVTPIFRYGRQGFGRLRQAHQVGIELLGSNQAAADAEIIEITDSYCKLIGIQDAVVKLNSIGRAECRMRFGEVILNHLKEYLSDQSTEAISKAEKNPLGILDSKEVPLQEALFGLAPITNYLEDDAKARFEEIQELLTEAGITYRIDPRVVRGLDYYTETVFEVASASLGELSLAGGGRYDNLVKEIGGSATPCVGMALGIERMILAMEKFSVVPMAPKPTAFIASAGSVAAKTARELARDLRAKGLRIETDIDVRSLKSQLRQADKSGASVAILIGEDELANGTVTVRILGKSSQQSVPKEDIFQYLDQLTFQL